MWRAFVVNKKLILLQEISNIHFVNKINVNYGIYIYLYMYILYGWKFSGVLNFMKSCNRVSELIL